MSATGSTNSAPAPEAADAGPLAGPGAVGGAFRIRMSAIKFDVSTQCRTGIDPATVVQYAEDKRNGATFPPPELYGTKACCWIGDGWHRIEADRKNGLKEIDAILRPGNRLDALRHALKANSSHGKQRSKADKRRAVTLALAEFSDLSSRQISELCDVSHTFVETVRSGGNVATSATRIGADGKRYSGGNVATSKPTAFDLENVRAQLREAFGKLFSRCPADRRRDLGSMVAALLKEVQGE
ncbi:MAG: ParB/RepB/Spo0J family partition protein [Lentisphaerae bacterium]|nr:ParB/RepB/Spo0J family partition protein [Lentisphaerota bacterium]